MVRGNFGDYAGQLVGRECAPVQLPQNNNNNSNFDERLERSQKQERLIFGWISSYSASLIEWKSTFSCVCCVVPVSKYCRDTAGYKKNTHSLFRSDLRGDSFEGGKGGGKGDGGNTQEPILVCSLQGNQNCQGKQANKTLEKRERQKFK